MSQRNEIEGAIRRVTGDPSSGVVAEIIPAIVAAVMGVLEPAAPETTSRSTRVVKATEER